MLQYAWVPRLSFIFHNYNTKIQYKDLKCFFRQLALNLFATNPKINMSALRNENPKKRPREPPIAVKMSPASNYKNNLY